MKLIFTNSIVPKINLFPISLHWLWKNLQEIFDDLNVSKRIGTCWGTSQNRNIFLIMLSLHMNYLVELLTYILDCIWILEYQIPWFIFWHWKFCFFQKFIVPYSYFDVTEDKHDDTSTNKNLKESLEKVPKSMVKWIPQITAIVSQNKERRKMIMI